MNWRISPQADRKGNEVLIKVVKYRPASAKEIAEGDGGFKRIRETLTMLIYHHQSPNQVLKITAQERPEGWFFNLHEPVREVNVEVRSKRMAYVTQAVPDETRIVKRSHGACDTKRFFKLLADRTHDVKFTKLIKRIFTDYIYQ